jgi:ABC-type enterochelin transport system permease subunit
MPGGIGKAFSVAIAAQFQALGMLGLAWYAGDWLNHHYPKSFNWFFITFLISIVAIAQTFYVMLRHFMKTDQASLDSNGRLKKPRGGNK